VSSIDHIPAAGLKRLDERETAVLEGSVLCFACVRNEALRLPYFLDYHRTLGVQRFHIVDNGSTDETRAFLLAQPDVYLFSADGSYAASMCGVRWMNALLTAFAPGHWALTLDADELLVYSRCETLPLQGLVDQLNRQGSDALPGFMLDIYAAGPIRAAQYKAGTPFLDTCSYFDVDTYHERTPQGLPSRGGPRHRLFWEGREWPSRSPVLDKIPLVRWREGLHYEASTHRISGNIVLAEANCLLLHFKLFADFFESAAMEAMRKEHWDGAGQYAAYSNVLQDFPDLSAHFFGSLRYESSEQLMAIGLLRDLWG